MKQCPNGHSVDDNAKFCPQCGAEIVDFICCANCGKELDGIEKFCPKCGAAIVDNYENEEDGFESSNHSNKKIIVAVVAIATALLGVGLWYYFSTQSKESVAVATVEEKPIFDSVIVRNEIVEIEEMPIDTLEMLAHALNSQPYQSVSFFIDGFAAVCNNGKYGFIDISGNEVVSCRYDEVTFFNEGLARVKKDGSWGFVDSLGNEILPCVYASLFNHERIIKAYRNDKWELLNNKGELLADLGRVSALRWVWDEGTIDFERDGKFGFVNYQGKEIVPCVYDIVSRFSGGIAAVKKDGKWGFVNKTGNVVIPIVYDSVFSDKNDAILVKKDGRWGLIDNSNNVLASFQYSLKNTSGFTNGYECFGGDRNHTIIVVVKDGKFVLLDVTGKEITPFIYDDISNSFRDGFASVKKDGKYGIIDINGNEVIPCRYEMTSVFDSHGGETFSVSENEKWGLIDNQGKEIIPCVYESANRAQMIPMFTLTEYRFFTVAKGTA